MLNTCRMLFLALKRGSNCQKHYLSDSHYLTKKWPRQHFTLIQLERCSYPLMPFQKLLIAHFQQKRIFSEKWLTLALLFLLVVFYHTKVFHEKSLEQIMRYIRLHNFWASCTQISHMPQNMIFFLKLYSGIFRVGGMLHH